MQKLLIRHAESEANRSNAVAITGKDMWLTDEGKVQATDLGIQLEVRYGFKPRETSAAISEYRRTRETARFASFGKIAVNPKLNEVQVRDSVFNVLRNVRRGILVPEITTRAELLLQDPPKQDIWISHALLIAGVCNVLGIHQSQRIPDFGDIIEVEL